MYITPVEDQHIWTDFFDSCGSPTFLQSWEWGELQKQEHYQVLRVGVYDEKQVLAAVAQIIKIRAKRGNMIFIPHGPIIRSQKNQTAHVKKIVGSLLDYTSEIAAREGFSFIRISPILEDGPENRALFAQLGFRTSPIYMHAERIWQLNITDPEESLLARMRKTTRYSIRKAEKEGVIIEKFPISNEQVSKLTEKQVMDAFWDVYEKTADREGFTPFSKRFIEHEFKEYHKNGNALFLLGRIPNSTTYEAAALIIFTASSGFYHQGASLHSKIPVAYLMQWEAIREAKKRECTLYNFWGTLQPGRTPKSWGGLSLFKQGFGGFQTDYVPTQDYIVSPRYWLSFAFELYLKWKRGI